MDKNVYLLVGEEIGKKEDFIEKLPEKKEITHLWGDEVSADDILKHLFQYHLFSERRLILVHSWEAQKDKEKNLLIDKLKAKKAYNLLVLLFNLPMFRLPQNIKEKIENLGIILNFSPASYKEKKEYIEKEAGDFLEEEAKELFLSLVFDADILSIKQELDKLKNYIKKDKKISADFIKEVLFPSSGKIPTLIDKIRKKEYYPLAFSGYEPTSLLFYFARELSKLYCNLKDTSLEDLIISAYITEFLLKSHADAKLRNIILEHLFLKRIV